MPDTRLILGDCRKILPTLEGVDVVITDPPYGVDVTFGNVKYSRRGATVRHRGNIIGDKEPFDPSPLLGYRIVILCGANNFASRLPDSRGWVYWDKREGMKENDFGDGELIWTNQDRVIRKFNHRWNGVIRDSQNGDEHYHPTEKPIALFTWLIKNYAEDATMILDPYMGSGSCGIAAVQLGIPYIGIEIDPTYYAIAEKRIAQAKLQIRMPI